LSLYTVAAFVLPKITVLRGKDGSEIGFGLEQSILSVAEAVVH